MSGMQLQSGNELLYLQPALKKNLHPLVVVKTNIGSRTIYSLLPSSFISQVLPTWRVPQMMKGLRRFFSTFAATLCHAVHAHNLTEILLLFYHNLTKIQLTFLTTKHFIRQLISYDCKFSLAMDLPACELGIKNIWVLSCGPWSRVRIPSAVKCVFHPCQNFTDT